MVVKNFARDRSRRLGAKPAVFDNHRERYFRRLQRREGHVKRMIAMAFSDTLGIIALVLLNPDHLRGAGFSSRGISRAGKNRLCSTHQINVLHGRNHQIKMGSVDSGIVQDLGGDDLILGSARVDNAPH